jgi:aminoglycoside 2''-phosphotransferase
MSTAERLNQRLPQMKTLIPGLEVTSARFIDDGLANEVVIVNETLVFRFVKASWAYAALEAELAVLAAARPYVDDGLPELVAVAEGVSVFKFVTGVPLTTAVLGHLDVLGQTHAAAQLGAFLSQLHRVPLGNHLPQTSAPTTRDAWLSIQQGVEEFVYPLLLPHQREWAEGLFNFVLDDPEFFNVAPAVIHGDLAPYHLLVDPAEPALQGVIDFGVAGVGDPAVDVACLMQYYGGRFVQRMLPVYPGLEKLLPRAAFYAQALELQWVLQGLKYTENFWFAAHLGAARDL